jgi:hypothetical protein
MKTFTNLFFWHLLLWGALVLILLLPPLAMAAYLPRSVVFIGPSLSPWAVVFGCLSQLGVLAGATLVTYSARRATP